MMRTYFVLFVSIGVRGGGAGGAAAPPVAKIFGQNTCDSGKSTWDKTDLLIKIFIYLLILCID